MWAELFMVLRWWLVLLLIGGLATPVTWFVFGGGTGFGRLPTLGYAFAKPFGLLIVSYIFWLLGSFGFLNNSLGGILFAIIVLAGLSAAVLLSGTVPVSGTLRDQARYMLIVELLFLIAFVAWAWMRAQNPQIAFTEKPMEFAFLNSVGRSPTFPPLDPWLSGFAISYYYFGYIMVSVITRLAFVPTAIGFNLATAWLFAATMIGAFGLIFDLVLLAQTETRRRAVGYTIALVGAIGVGLAGNLQIVLETAHANGIGSAEFYRWLDIKDIDTPPVAVETPRYETSTWWWWRSSRLINERNLAGDAEGVIEPIAEFPAFSFSLGDLHPHVLALPFAFLSIGLALTWYLRPSAASGVLSELRNRRTLLHFGISALIIGGLSFLNTWDVLIHLFILVGAIGLANWRTLGQWRSDIFTRCLQWFAAFVAAAYVLYLPFYIGFSSQAGAPFILPTLVQPTRLAQFFIFFGMPLTVIVLLLAVVMLRQRMRHLIRGLAVAGSLVAGLLLVMVLMGIVIASSPLGLGSVGDVARYVGVDVGVPGGTGLGRLTFAASAVLKLLPAILGTRIQFIGVTLLLGLVIAACVAITTEQFAVSAETTPQNSGLTPLSITPFVLLLVLTGALLTIGPEYVYLKDQFGQRLNTIFKFWYQAWVLFGVAAAVGLYLLAQKSRPVAAVAGTGYTAMLAGSLLFPFYMAQWGQLWYGNPPTLNGLASVAINQPDEYAAIDWLTNSSDAPVVLEAVGGQYSDYARVSARTGLPTVLGWAGHQRQWRGDTPEPGERDPIIAQIYSQRDWTNIPELLDRYEVDYIYFGRLEREAYGIDGQQKFNDNMVVSFQNDSVTIYAWE